MRRATKHQFKKVQFAPLNGGINVSQVPEQIAENEMQECQNFWYEKDSMRLVGRGGLSQLATFQSRVRSMYYDIETNTTFAFLENRDCYQVTLGSSSDVQKNFIDKVSGSKQPMCCKFNNKLFVASGEWLQFYDYDSKGMLQSIMTSPKCDKLFYRFGRLAVARTGSDRITYSSTGDATSDVAWEENTNDDSSSKWLDIGSDDGGDIVEIVPLATDMIIFKSNGKAYQFVGDADFNTWSVYNVANHTDIAQNFTNGTLATNLGQEVVFLSLRGLKSLAATQDYGNITATDIGSKFAKLITDDMYEPEFFHLRRHKTLMIRPKADATYFVAYNYGIGSATTIKFGMTVQSILETKDDVFVACGNTIYRWSIEATTDDNQPIEYIMKPRVVLGSDEVLVKAIDTKFSSDHSGEAVVSIDRLSVKMPTNSRRKVRCNHSTDAIDLEVRSNSRFELDHIVLDVADL